VKRMAMTNDLDGAQPRADVCVIDDDGGIRRIIARVLEAGGFAVSEASDGHAGIRSVAATHAHVAVVDLFMPGLDGLETIPALKLQFPSLRILAISGVGAFDSTPFLNSAALLGADDCLEKPFRMSVLVGKVIALMRRPAVAHPVDLPLPSAGSL
jgi:two-component system chemotaxis response regulator CheY